MLLDENVPSDAPDLRAALDAASLPTIDLEAAGRTFFRFSEGGQAFVEVA